MIVRGFNTTGSDLWVTLAPWRAFAVAEVVTMDETPTGGKLPPDEQGAIRFTQRFGSEVLQAFLVGQSPLPNQMTERAVTANHVSRDKNARRGLVRESTAGHAAKN